MIGKAGAENPEVNAEARLPELEAAGVDGVKPLEVDIREKTDVSSTESDTSPSEELWSSKTSSSEGSRSKSGGGKMV